MESFLNKIFRKSKTITTTTSNTPTTFSNPDSYFKNEEIEKSWLGFGSSSSTRAPTASVRTIPIIFITTPSSKKPIEIPVHHENSQHVNEDIFYKLKQHCDTKYDTLCVSKRREMYDLIEKCDKIKQTGKGTDSQLKSCREVLSIYCYIFPDLGIHRCKNYDQYDAYVPGKIKPITTTTTTSKRVPFFYSTPKNIPINPVNPVITTTSTNTKSTTRSSSTTTSTKKVLVDTANSADPFGNEPVNSIPKSSEKLKQIGNFCLKQKTKHANCEKMLVLLRTKFKTCEKAPKTNADCQSFKMDFCSAFTNFPCCVDVT